MTKENMSYDRAVNEIEEILGKIESGELGVDELSLKVERVSGLLTYCREKLHLAEKKVEEILREKKED